MVRIKKELHGEKTILVVDYSDLKEAGMIELLMEVKDVLAKENKPQLILNYFNSRNYLTPAFMNQAKKISIEYSHLVGKRAIVGINDVKKFILKGLNLFLGTDFHI